MLEGKPAPAGAGLPSKRRRGVGELIGGVEACVHHDPVKRPAHVTDQIRVACFADVRRVDDRQNVRDFLPYVNDSRLFKLAQLLRMDFFPCLFFREH